MSQPSEELIAVVHELDALLGTRKRLQVTVPAALIERTLRLLVPPIPIPRVRPGALPDPSRVG